MIAKLALRLIVGGVFAAHGLQKLAGAWGGGGLDSTERSMAGSNMHPVKANALLVAGTETLGGAAIALGAATPVAAGGLIATMITAIRKVHGRNGFFAGKGGYEFNLTLIGALLAIVADGPGAASADAFVGRRRWGLWAALLALGGGALASTLAIDLGEASAPEAAAATAAAAATKN
ncbi:DoxX family protein [Pseudolysinimonas sp.]|uniref:DoxX family protein n=1 Tax=Pseudolysinimonas sp. TaxID=2680009 RepID=UPI003F7FECEE